MRNRAARIRSVSVSGALLASALLVEPAAAQAPAPAYPAADDMPMDWTDRRDFDFASRGFIANRKDPLIRNENGDTAADLKSHEFLDNGNLATVHPSLLRQARILNKSGLFEVVDGVYQVRGFDITNVTFIRGDTGWIVIDPAFTPATAKAAYELVSENLGQRPIKALIYTHSHPDHFGGAAGLVSQKSADAGNVQVLAPKGFLDAVLGEFLVNGAAMQRRMVYSGMFLKPGPLGSVSGGLGNGGARGPLSLIAPTQEISQTGEERTIDGVKFVFQMTPGTEAPAEMNIYLPQYRVLDMAENANVTLHNVLTPRGAKVRDSKFWADQLTQSIKLFGAKSDAVILSHGWPRFVQKEVVDYLSKHRDAYKFVHDQTVRLINDGVLPDELANRLRLPDSLAREWYNRGYYGSVSFNSRAVYQRYLGWYHGNPIDLQPLEPAEEARRYVRAMGGRHRVLELAKLASNEKRQWSAELLNRLVMADASDQRARDLLADTYTALAFEQENGVWRAQYLSAARELRTGVGQMRMSSLDRNPLLEKLPTATLFEMLAVRLDPSKVGDASTDILFVLPERGETILVTVRNQVLTYDMQPEEMARDATVVLDRAQLVRLISEQSLDRHAKVKGSREAVETFARWFTPPKEGFPIVWRPDSVGSQP